MHLDVCIVHTSWYKYLYDFHLYLFYLWFTIYNIEFVQMKYIAIGPITVPCPCICLTKLFYSFLHGSLCTFPWPQWEPEVDYLALLGSPLLRVDKVAPWAADPGIWRFDTFVLFMRFNFIRGALGCAQTWAWMGRTRRLVGHFQRQRKWVNVTVEEDTYNLLTHKQA